MKKGLIVFILIIVGAIAGAGLAIAAILELAEAIIAVVVWGVIIGGGYLIFKIRE